MEKALQEEYAARRVRTVDEKGRAYATGKRKASIARVWIWEGPGQISINGRRLDMHFHQLNRRLEVLSPFQAMPYPLFSNDQPSCSAASTKCMFAVWSPACHSYGCSIRWDAMCLHLILMGHMTVLVGNIRAHGGLCLRQVTDTLGFFSMWATVKGGGTMGQAQALRHGVSCALQKWDPELRPLLRAEGFLTRDPRIVERKKPGRAKARKAFQWVKR